MKDKIRKVSKEITHTVSMETGEIVDTHVSHIELVVEKDDFSLIYSEFWNILLDKPLSTSDVQLLAFLIKNYSDGTPFSINSFIKEEVAKQTNKSVSSYNNCTRNLLKHALIFSVSNKVYKLNPRYSFKGSTKDRNKAVITMLTSCKEC